MDKDSEKSGSDVGENRESSPVKKRRFDQIVDVWFGLAIAFFFAAMVLAHMGEWRLAMKAGSIWMLMLCVCAFLVCVYAGVRALFDPGSLGIEDALKLIVSLVAFGFFIWVFWQTLTR